MYLYIYIYTCEFTGAMGPVVFDEKATLSMWVQAELLKSQHRRRHRPQLQPQKQPLPLPPPLPLPQPQPQPQPRTQISPQP